MQKQPDSKHPMPKHHEILGHLGEAANALARKDDKERLEYFDEDRFFETPGSKELTELLASLVTKPDTLKPESYALIGTPDSGKSALLQRVFDMNPPSDNVDGEQVNLPILRVQFSERGGDDLWSEITSGLNIVLPSTANKPTHRDKAIKAIRDLSVKVIMIDEIANVMDSTERRRAIAFNAIKYLVNSHRRPIVLGVTPEVWNLIEEDDHMRARFEPKFLTGMHVDGEDYLETLRKWELSAPLRKPSNLTDEKLRLAIHKLTTDGRIGEIIRVLKKLGRAAVGAEECVSLDLMARVRLETRADHIQLSRHLSDYGMSTFTRPK